MPQTKEEKDAYHKAYRAKNKEQIAAKKRDYREENKEKISEDNKKYYEDNQQKIHDRRQVKRQERLVKIAEWQLSDPKYQARKIRLEEIKELMRLEAINNQKEK